MALRYRIGDMIVDGPRRTILRDGVQLHLRPKSFSVLIYLLHHQDRVVTKEELHRALWQHSPVTDDALVRCIIEIRRILDLPGVESSAIRNVPRVGYQFAGSADLLEEVEPVLPASPPMPWWRNRRLALAAAVALPLAVIAGGFLTDSAYRTVGPLEVARWRMDGRPDSGVVIGNASWDPGILNQGVRLHGPNSYLNGAGKGFPQHNDARTVTAWIHLLQSKGDYATILHYGLPDESPTGANFHFRLTHDGRLNIGSSWDHAKVVGKSVLAPGRWHHVAGVYSGPPANTATLYVDGVQDFAAKVPKGFWTGPGSSWRIGGSGTTFPGTLDDIRLFGGALSRHQIQSIYRCQLPTPDFTSAAGPFWYMPVFPITVGVADPPSPGESSAPFRNAGKDFSAMQLVRKHADCNLESFRGANFGQDLHIGVDLLVPDGENGEETHAGPYFRARAASPGDGIIGGTAGGYWVTLSSQGNVQIWCLNPKSVVALTTVSAFDSRRFHRLEAEAVGDHLRLWLDGKPLSFDHDGKTVDRLEIPPVWEHLSPKGNNHGAAGIAFAAIYHRGQAGGQVARNLSITRF